jgi:hypothetical protein
MIQLFMRKTVFIRLEMADPLIATDVPDARERILE